MSIHAKVEEEIFYPAVRGVGADDSERLVLEAREEHALVKGLLAELRGMSPADESFAAKMKVVMDLVEHHAEEEEKEMFDAAEELGDDELLQLGERIARRKPELEEEFESKGQRADTARRGSARSARGGTRSRGANRSSNGGRQRGNGSRRR